MHRFGLAFLAACSIGALASPASAIVVGASNIDLTDTPFTFGFADSSFTFSYQPSGSFDFNPVFVQTTGSGATTAFGGFLGIPLSPSTFFTRANVEIGPDTFPGFAAFETATAVPFSIVDGDLGLRVSVGADNFYGYARFGGSLIQSIAFETDPNTSIVAGSFPAAAAVPEPATWAMMIGGIGLAGAALRRRRTTTRVAFAI